MVYECQAKVSFVPLLCNPLIPAFSPGRRSFSCSKKTTIASRHFKDQSRLKACQSPAPGNARCSEYHNLPLSAVDVYFLSVKGFHQAEPDEIFFAFLYFWLVPKVPIPKSRDKPEQGIAKKATREICSAIQAVRG